jgi:uncharacterized membrane protein
MVHDVDVALMPRLAAAAAAAGAVVASAGARRKKEKRAVVDVIGWGLVLSSPLVLLALMRARVRSAVFRAFLSVTMPIAMVHTFASYLRS